MITDIKHTKNKAALWKIYLFFLTLGLLLILAFYFVKYSQPKIEHLKKLTGMETPSTQNFADTYLNKASIANYVANGNLNYKLDADSLENFDNEKSIKMTNPKILYLEDRRLQVTSLQGLLSNKKKLRLDGDVVLRALDENAQLHTEHVDINLNRKEISNNIGVVFTSNNAKITSTGMHVNLDSEKLQLKSRVRGVYEP